MKSKTLATALLSATFLAGCERAPDKEITDGYVEKWMAAAEDKAALEGTHYIMDKHPEGELGVLYAKSVKANPTESTTCMKYSVLTFANKSNSLFKFANKYIAIKSVETNPRTVCTADNPQLPEESPEL